MDTRTELSSSRPPRRGAAMVAALLVVFAVGGLVTGLLQVGVAFNREAGGRLDDERALQLAEAALAEAMVALRAGKGGAVASDALPARLGDGLLWVASEDISNDVVRLTGAAMAGGARVALEQLVFHYGDTPFDTTIFAAESLVLSSNTLIDSYDSALGTYADQLAASGGDHVDDGAVLQSNGDVQIGSAADVYGDVHPGNGDSLVMASNADLSGISLEMSEDRTLDPVVTPAIPISGPAAIMGNQVLPAGDYGFTSFWVWTGAQLTVQGPARIVMTDWTVASNATVTLDASGGPIEIYLSDDLTLASNSTIVTPFASATGVSVHLTGDATQVADFRSNSEFYGTIYGPNAHVILNSNFELFGAVSARAVTISSNTAIHYDEQLHTASREDETYVVAAWSRAGFPRQDLLKLRIDPFVLLGVDPAALPAPADAHAP